MNFYYSNATPKNTKISFFILSLAKRFRERCNFLVYGFGFEQLKKLDEQEIEIYEHRPIKILRKSLGLVIDGIALLIAGVAKFVTGKAR